MRADSSLADSSGTACAISEKRSGPSSSTLRIAPVQRRPTSSIASWKYGQQRSAASAVHPPSGGASAALVLCAVALIASGTLRGLERARLLAGTVDRHLAGDVDHRRKALQRHRRDRFQQLLIVPARLTRLLVQA